MEGSLLCRKPCLLQAEIQKSLSPVQKALCWPSVSRPLLGLNSRCCLSFDARNLLKTPAKLVSVHRRGFSGKVGSGTDSVRLFASNDYQSSLVDLAENTGSSAGQELIDQGEVGIFGADNMDVVNSQCKESLDLPRQDHEEASGDASWHPLVAPGILFSLGGLVAGLNLEGPGSVLEAMAVLAVIVTVHECGHFLAARLQNIHVTKFSIGFGPVLSKFRGEKVEYTLRAIPLGGFVAFPDDDPESQIPPTDPDLLKNRPIWDRALVISAGVLANVLFAYSVLFTQVNTVGLLQQTFKDGVAVPDVSPGSAGDRAGLVKGDVIVKVNGSSLTADQQSVLALVDEIKGSRGKSIHLDVLRKQEPLSLDITPDGTTDGSGRIGVQLAPNADTVRVRAANLAEATVFATREFSRLFTTVTDGLQQIIFNFAQTADRVSGPVAIVAVGAEVARSDIAGLFQFAALVNINLAVVNILPLPALDGGYLALLLLEALRGGRKLPSGLEQGIMSSGIILLLGTGLLLMVRDTLSLGGML